eukprot:scaffold6916_cov143-Skeletonema_menzelii.AAC.3
MKSIISVAAICLSLAQSSMAFVPTSPYVASPSRTSSLSMAKLDMTPELEAAIADVRECASAFSDETAHFANGRFGCNLEIDVNETAYIFC